jgi:hypothetical protein
MIHWNLDTITLAPTEIVILYRRAGQYYHEQQEVRLVIEEQTLIEKTATWKGGSGKAPERSSRVLYAFASHQIPASALYQEFLFRLKEATMYALTPLEYLVDDLEKERET